MDYPKRPPFFAHKFVRLLTKSCAAQDIGRDAFCLLCIIAHTEDAARYSGPVRFWNEQLMTTMGFKSPKQLNAARSKSVSFGWLSYDRSGNREVGRYFVTVPEQFEGLDDAVIEGNHSVNHSADGTNSGTNSGTNLVRIGDGMRNEFGTESGKPSIPVPFPVPNTYTPGNEIVVPNAVNTPECHEAARKWFRHMDESGHTERVPIQNSQAEEDFWREAYKMGHDGFIDAVQYSIGKVSWLSIQERPKTRSGTNGNGKKNGHSKYSKDLINAIKVCQSHPGGDKWQEREKILGAEVTKALKAAGGSTMLVEVAANDFKLQTFSEIFESHLADIRKAGNGSTSSH